MKITITTKRDLTQQELQVLTQCLDLLASALNREVPVKKFTNYFFEELENLQQRMFISMLDNLHSRLAQQIKNTKNLEISVESANPSYVKEFQIITPLELVSEFATIPSSGPCKARSTNSSKERGYHND